MPKKPAPDPAYGYAPETNTVRAGPHDLARLPLTFREPMREQPPGRWRHMDDYDLAFERLADAVDAGSQLRYGKRWTGPDLVLGQDTEDLGGRGGDTGRVRRRAHPRRRSSARSTASLSS
ncbi:hypothetical protein ACFQ9J_17390 [Streptomyces sp. NPDC056529]|uniref:hypothetical protein n=1 Tax=Streptomyces sp. NPDC056529 TaxID=3345855 RepID=UPI0036D09576